MKFNRETLIQLRNQSVTEKRTYYLLYGAHVYVKSNAKFYELLSLITNVTSRRVYDWFHNDVIPHRAHITLIENYFNIILNDESNN